MNEEIYVALDLGNSKIRMMAARRDENGLLDILGAEECKPKENIIRHGIVKNSSEVAFAISELSTKLTNRMNNRQRIVRLYISINGRSLRTVRHRVEQTFDKETKITKAELANLQKSVKELQLDGLQIYGINNEEYGIDGKTVINPEGLVCSKIEANYLVACALPLLRDNLQKCVDHQPTIEDFDTVLSPRAIAEAVTTPQERNSGCAIVNIGAATTTVTVFHSGILRHIAVIPFGGQHITNDLQHLDLTPDVAELVKCSEHSSALDKGTKIQISGRAGSEVRHINTSEITNIIDARLDETIKLCMAEIERSGYSSQLESGIILTGGGSKLNDIVPYIKEKTGLPVSLGSHAENLTETSKTAYSGAEYALLTGILLTADKPCTKAEAEISQEQNKPHKPKKSLKSKIYDIFGGNESSIQD